MLVTEFSTGDVAPRDRFASFEAFATQSHIRTVLRSNQQDDFRARMRVLELGELQVSALTYPHLEVVRTPKLIRQGDPEVYEINSVLAVSGRMSQDGHEATFRSGDLVLLDSSRPFRVWLDAAPDRVATVVARIPRALLPLPWTAVRRLVATPIPATHGMSGVFHRWLADLAANAGGFTPANVPTLASITTDLLTSLLGRHLDTGETMTPQSRRRTLRVQVHDFVRQHLGDPSLSPVTLAEAHRVSVRSLQQLFADEGTTPAAWIRHLRLERCRHDLADPRLRLRPVHAVAARWGFTDAGHFSRAFRAAYGVPPRDYRHQALRDAEQETAGTWWP